MILYSGNLRFSESTCLSFEFWVSGLPYGMISVIGLRIVVGFQFVQLYSCCEDRSDDLQAPYIPDQKLEDHLIVSFY